VGWAGTGQHVDSASRRLRRRVRYRRGALLQRRRGVSQAGRRVGCVGWAELRWPGGVVALGRSRYEVGRSDRGGCNRSKGAVAERGQAMRRGISAGWSEQTITFGSF
jgi:hypothetical protein